jgi:hypothetical protein
VLVCTNLMNPEIARVNDPSSNLLRYGMPPWAGHFEAGINQLRYFYSLPLAFVLTFLFALVRGCHAVACRAPGAGQTELGRRERVPPRAETPALQIRSPTQQRQSRNGRECRRPTSRAHRTAEGMIHIACTANCAANSLSPVHPVGLSGQPLL